MKCEPPPAPYCWTAEPPDKSDKILADFSVFCCQTFCTEHYSLLRCSLLFYTLSSSGSNISSFLCLNKTVYRQPSDSVVVLYIYSAITCLYIRTQHKYFMYRRIRLKINKIELFVQGNNIWKIIISRYVYYWCSPVSLMLYNMALSEYVFSWRHCIIQVSWKQYLEYCLYNELYIHLKITELCVWLHIFDTVVWLKCESSEPINI